MKRDDVENMLGGMNIPQPGNIPHQKELKIPLLSYKRSSKVGLWLLILPLIIAIAGILKYEIGIPPLAALTNLLAAVDSNPVLTYLIPLVVLGLPLLVMTMNFMAFCHFDYAKEKHEYLVTIKVRPLNIALFLFSFAILVYFFLPDRLSF